jgi:protein-S-isoprenylcysteine O-methyltransferase Ste14
LGGHPTWINELGLVGVIGGAVLLLWVLLQHSENATNGWKLGNPFEGQGYVLTGGPYRFCRHPMHIATTAIWFGWGVFYGSAAVAEAASVILLMIVVFVPAEERGIEAKLGEEYRQYKARVPRWPWQSGRS